jgi:hypothetical protein
VEITTSELRNLPGKLLLVQVNVVGSDEEDFREVRGRCLVANNGGLVIQTKHRSEMIQMRDIIDIEYDTKPKRLARRRLDEISDEAVRQHLLDRHGLPYEIVKQMDVQTAVTLHNKYNHGTLGHEHGTKPTRGSKKNGDDQ